MDLKSLNEYEQAIVKNADWFISNQKEEGYIDVAGDEFYGVKGDATLIGHSVTVRMYAYALTNKKEYMESAQNSLRWLAERQDPEGGWKKHCAYTLDAAQCVFEGFNTYYKISKDEQFLDIQRKAADRMISGTIDLDNNGKLLLPEIVEIGEYAHFSLLAWKTFEEAKYKTAGETILNHIYDNFDEKEGYWYPYDKHRKAPTLAFLFRPFLRTFIRNFNLKGKLVSKISGHLLPYVTASTRPQYSMSLMDTEVLIDTLDGSCAYPKMQEQTKEAIQWVKNYCQGPFPGSVVESKDIKKNKEVFPLKIINDTTMSATWPTTCLLLAYCGLNDPQLKEEAKKTADYLLSIQDEEGGFYNFQKPDENFLPLQSGNVNFYASMSLWLYNEVYENGKVKLYTK